MNKAQAVRPRLPARHWISKELILAIICSAVVLMLGLLVVCYQLIEPSAKFIVSIPEATIEAPKPKQLQYPETGLVLGAGIGPNGKPYKELKARLDKAAEALNKGMVRRLILSGDNRFVEYNEPLAMKTYLVETKQVSADALILDYAGRSTYESCERASKVFKQTAVTIFSAQSHLPRAIYLCRHFGLTAYGVASEVEADNSGRREPLARVKAVLNVYVHGEKTVL